MNCQDRIIELLNTIYKNNIYSQFYFALLNKTIDNNDKKVEEFTSIKF